MNSSLQNILPFLVFAFLVTPQNCSNFTLGPNLVNNPGFENPVLNLPSAFQQYFYSIPSWNCKIYFELLYIPIYCTFVYMPCSISSNQMLDMDANDNEVINQTVTVPSPGVYQLSFQWAPPVYSGVGRYLQVRMDQTLLTNITINALNVATNYPYNFSTSLNVSANSAVLQFRMGGTPNGYGIMIDNIALQQVLQNNSTAPVNTSTANSTTNTNQNATVAPSNSTPGNPTSPQTNPGLQPSNQTTNPNLTPQNSNATSMSQINTIVKFLFFNKLQQTSNSVPGGRVFLSAVLSFMTHFDRLQLYYYHNQNLTKNSLDFLQMVSQLEGQKGSLIQNILDSINTDNSTSSNTVATAIINFQNNTIKDFNFKQPYSNPYVQNLNQYGTFFYANNFDFFYYSAIGTLGFHLIFYLSFRLLFNYRISVFFRKYCFLAMLYFQLFAGNSEQFTFFYFQDLKALFTFNYSQKVYTVFLLLFYFILFFFSFAGILLLKFWYNKNVKYFIQKPNRELLSLLYLIFEVGVVPIALGSVHSLLIHNLFLQTAVLMSLQTLFCFIYLHFLVNNVFDLKIITCIKIIASMLRICFNLVFYISNRFHEQELLNSVVSGFIVFYISICLIQLLAQIYIVIAGLFAAFRLVRIEKVSDKQSQIHTMQLRKIILCRENGVKIDLPSKSIKKLPSLPKLGGFIYQNIQFKKERKLGIKKPEIPHLKLKKQRTSKYLKQLKIASAFESEIRQQNEIQEIQISSTGH